MSFNLEEYLPYGRWRRGQRNLAKEVFRTVVNGELLLAEYPTGAGKTIASIIGVLKAIRELGGGYKVFYLAKTKNQALQPFKELKKLRNKGIDVNFIFFRNKKDMCGFKHKMSYDEFIYTCNIYRKEGLCSFYKKTLKEDSEHFKALLDTAEDPMHFISLTRENGLCPYEVARALAGDAEFIIGAYQYIFNHEIRDVFLGSLNLDLNDIVLIIDEAHNLPDILSDMYSYSINEITIRAAKKEVRKYGGWRESLDFLTKLLSLIQGFKVQTKRLGWIEVNPSLLLSIAPETEVLNETLLNILRQKGFEAPSKSYFYRIHKFILKLKAYNLGYTLVIRSREDILTLDLICFDVSREVSRIFNNVHSAVLMSGTLQPREYISSILGINPHKIREFRIPRIFPVENWLVYVATDVTSKYSERGDYMYRKIAEYINVIDRGVGEKCVRLVVFPSYDLMKAIMPYIESREMIIEREDTSISEVIRKIRDMDRPLILSVAGGKLMEGIEIRHERRSLIRVVVVAGLPFPEPSIYSSKLIDVLAARLKSKDKAWQFVFVVPAVIRVRQSAGRAVRSDRDRVVVFVLDKRMLNEKVRKYLSLEFSNPRIVNGIQNLEREFAFINEFLSHN